MSYATRFDDAPMMLYWELTRACSLACQHCRADAIPARHPRELSTLEGKRLLDQIRAFGDGAPHVVFTGGDPLQRPDLFELLNYAVGLGLAISVSPSGTPLLTREAIRGFKASGVSSLAFSLDGSTAARHDRIRGIPGTFDRTISVIGWSAEAGVPVQVNTLVAAETLSDIPAMYDLVRRLDVHRWALFFLIGVGRGAVLNDVSPEEAEALLEWVASLAAQPKPVIKTTEAHHYRRIIAQRAKSSEDARPAAENQRQSVRRGWGIRDGAGIMFISHTGQVYPSGFLPIPAGNVRRQSPIAIYREAPLFRQLRDPDQLEGKCGRCEFRVICGGSRARAYAATGSPFGADPLCPYEPPATAPDFDQRATAEAGRGRQLR